MYLRSLSYFTQYVGNALQGTGVCVLLNMHAIPFVFYSTRLQSCLSVLQGGHFLCWL